MCRCDHNLTNCVPNGLKEAFNGRENASVKKEETDIMRVSSDLHISKLSIYELKINAV